jgi:hypothetical protein
MNLNANTNATEVLGEADTLVDSLSDNKPKEAPVQGDIFSNLDALRLSAERLPLWAQVRYFLTSPSESRIDTSSSGLVPNRNSGSILGSSRIARSGKRFSSRLK